MKGRAANCSTPCSFFALAVVAVLILVAAAVLAVVLVLVTVLIIHLEFLHQLYRITAVPLQ